MKKKLTAGEYDIVLNGVRLHYTIRGTGPALIATWNLIDPSLWAGRMGDA